MLLLSLLERRIKRGTLILRMPDGTAHSFGAGEPRAEWILRNEDTARRLLRDPEFEVGETYLQGGWDAGEGGLRNLLAVLRSNFAPQQAPNWMKPLARLLQQFNRISSSYRNVAAHYDVPERVFRRFLDTEMFYSCAYFSAEDMTLEQAQQAKARHIARKLLIQSGDRILDIGCGWGSMAFYLAREYDCEVVGITLSKEQLAAAWAEQQKRGADRVRFELADYREHRGKYDRIVSVGMFEHVGQPFFGAYFDRVKELLTEKGVALIHTIGRSGPAGLTNAWIRKHIFPGGSTPSLSRIMPAVEKSGLLLCDLEVWRLHYAITLQHWYERFQHSRADIAADLGETFCRMWEFYLAACEAAFRYSDLVVFQAQLAREHGAAPLGREYLYR
ncbi:MAG: cyclopropane-fatty-acyl-phospholipid synthase family protein [Pseudomonadales bacterium]|jgi:cyclopropane-fatty-acyl-phospholipid synthase|nr:cyclopropane-fatty-acyl-phospholipid synthase family protein [Pseudomonadales bacterium]